MTISLKQLELILWVVTPACVSFFLFILYIIPKHLWGINYVMPILPLMSIFYWGRLYSLEIPYWFVFSIGLLMDVVSGIPLGLSALLYLLFLAMLHAQSKYLHEEGFIIVWGYFTILLAVISVFQFSVMYFSNNQLYAIAPAFLQWVITAGLYPLFHRMFDLLAEYIKQRRRIILHA